MKKLMYIHPETDEAKEILQAEANGSLIYSEEHNGFICYESAYNELDSKINLKSTDEEGCERFTVWDLGELLECDWEDEYVILHSGYGEDETIEHCLSGDWEIALSPYQDETYPDHDAHVKELFESEDWSKFLDNKIKAEMLWLIMDSIKMDVEGQIRNIKAKE